MLILHHNEKDFVYALIEWDIIKKNGYTYAYVRQLWVHQDSDAEKEISKFIFEMENDKRNKEVEYIYWQRIRKNGTRHVSPAFRRETCLRNFTKFIRRTSCFIS